jgi:hypothetical protein
VSGSLLGKQISIHGFSSLRAAIHDFGLPKRVVSSVSLGVFCDDTDMSSVGIRPSRRPNSASHCVGVAVTRRSV